MLDVGIDGDRWTQMIAALDELPPAEFDTVIARLQTIDLNSIPQHNRLKIWSSLRKLLSEHLRFPDAKWVMPQEAIDKIQSAYIRFEPDDPITRWAWLFKSEDELPMAGSADWKEREKALRQARVEAVEEIGDAGGLDILLSLAEQTKSAYTLGYSIGCSKYADSDEAFLLSRCLGSTNPKFRDVAFGFLNGRASLAGGDWLRVLRAKDESKAWEPQQVADYYRILPFSSNTWNELAREKPETQDLYWKEVAIFGHGEMSAEDCRAALDSLIQRDRLGTAIDFAALYTSVGKSRFDAESIAMLLERVLSGPVNEKVNWSGLTHDLSVLLDFLEKSGVIANERLGRMEWFFMPLVREHVRPPRALQKGLAESPEFFVEALTLLYRGDNDDPVEPNDEQRYRAERTYELLTSWNRLPGLGDKGNLNGEVLRDWVENARELANASGRLRVADTHIGKVLSHSPIGDDGAWPHEAVRDLLEDLTNEDIEGGMVTGIYNSRGVISRGIGEGGVQERAIAEHYSNHAKAITDGWPRVARLLRRIAVLTPAKKRRISPPVCA
jgi:hypothetical protein